MPCYDGGTPDSQDTVEYFSVPRGGTPHIPGRVFEYTKGLTIWIRYLIWLYHVAKVEEYLRTPGGLKSYVKA